MSHRLLRRCCPSSPTWAPTGFLSPLHTSCRTKKSTMPASLHLQKIIGFALNTCLPSREINGQRESPDSPCSYGYLRRLARDVSGRAVPPFAQPYNCSRKSAARGNPSLSQGQPHMCWGTFFFFFPCHGIKAWETVPAVSFQNPGLNKSSSTDWSCPVLQAGGTPSHTWAQCW